MWPYSLNKRFLANHSADNVPDHWWSLSSHAHPATSYLCEAAAAIWEGLSPCGWLVCSWLVHHTQYHRILPTGRHLNFALRLKTFINFWLNLKTFVRVLVLKSRIPSNRHRHFDITYLVMQQRALSVFKKGATPGLPDWLFWRQISQIWLFLEVVGVKKIVWLFGFFLQYLAFFGGSSHMLSDWCLGFLIKILLKSVIIRLS